MSLEYFHVNVFSRVPYRGNGLPVFPTASGLHTSQMLSITQELRHLEAIFLEPGKDANTVHARVFDLFEELPFAGHPIIGAAAILHHLSGRTSPQTWQFKLTEKVVSIATEQTEYGYTGLLNQGVPEFLGMVTERDLFARAFGLTSGDLHPTLPLEVVSTGLRYLIIPVRPGVLQHARILSDITEMLRRVRAQFAVLFDEAALEIRHWSNDGTVEDVATGSAAGTIGAYRLRHRLTRAGERFILNQGRFIGRPSTLCVQPEGTSEAIQTVKVGGDVVLLGHGALEVLPTGALQEQETTAREQ
ncbi:PhzF family phenazine biosynthesis protein [Tengunoibacter tsumagoiensis]|uniref:Phenazine biosynthesis protein PhzF n=1 Tax=Tengunoibacter tsumagoiensis TaxID=2014871 RepID=A0A401ZYL2_9CHLR|nr:PhzF family phenazine biosynthesis protein [Tengunoibacter tsumagoiensis]GCE11944.1 phenazine biosynthesis protein PhzF [Tengunoibacter tsumagoiensis]